MKTKTPYFALLCCIALALTSPMGCKNKTGSSSTDKASPAEALASGTPEFEQDPGWPRILEKPGAAVIAYQPQVDEWNNFSDVTWRQAFQITPAGGKQVIGAATFQGTTNVDSDKHMVAISGIRVINTYFPSFDEAASGKMDQLLKTFVPEVVDISLERVVAYMPKPQSVQAVNLKNDPPSIFVNYGPAILLSLDGEPVVSEIPSTKLNFIVNTQWAVFLDTNNSQYYLLAGLRWLTAPDLHGPWAAATKLPEDMAKLPKDPEWTDLKEVIPLPVQASGPIPKVFYSTVPAEVILFDGKPVFAKIPQTHLLYATNTDSPVFLYSPTNEYYYLAAGRWFRSKDMQGKWTFASMDLPEDFSKIPPASPAGTILSSVPGTDEAKDAVLISQIPTVMEIDPKSAAAKANVNYNGDPQFAPIEGTSLSYATNTADKVIKVGDVYYLCLQGVWFMSPNAQGPWTTASSVPQVIYTIPPSSPVYNVTYVTQTTTSSGTVQCSHTAGYWALLLLGLPLAPSLPMELAITIRPTFTVRRMHIRFIARIQCRMATALITTPQTARTVVMPRRTVRMAQQRGQLRTTRTAAPTNRAHPLQLLMAGKVSGRPTIPIPERTPQHIRDRVPPRSGVNPTSRMAINPPTHNTTRPRRERLHPRRGPRAERQSGLPPLMAMPRWAKLQAETCMPARTATFTRTRVQAGKNMTTVPAPGTPRPRPRTGSRLNRKLSHKNSPINNRIQVANRLSSKNSPINNRIQVANRLNSKNSPINNRIQVARRTPNRPSNKDSLLSSGPQVRKRIRTVASSARRVQTRALCLPRVSIRKCRTGSEDRHRPKTTSARPGAAAGLGARVAEAVLDVPRSG